MVTKISYTNFALKELSRLEKRNSKYLERVMRIIKEISVSPRVGSGKPERLKGCGSIKEIWSRRIDEKNRIVYEIKNNEIEIQRVTGHYWDN